MRMRLAWAAGTMLLIGLGAAAATYLAWRKDGINPTNYSRVQLGMTPKEVEGVIGLPPGVYYTRDPYGSISKGPFLRLLSESGIPENDLPIEMRRETRDGRRVSVAAWEGNDYGIWVAFDENEAAAGVYLFRVVACR